MNSLRYVIVCLVALLGFLSCEKDTKPGKFDVSMQYEEPTDVGRNSIRLNALLSSLEQVRVVGFTYWLSGIEGYSEQMNIKNPNTQSLSVLLEGLESGKEYCYQMYISNGLNRIEGGIGTFRTMAIGAPLLSELSFVGEERKIVRAVVQDDGVDGDGKTLVSKGFCWSVREGASISDQKIEIEGDGLTMEYDLSGIEADTFYIRAFACNNMVDTFAYGPELKIEREILLWEVGEVSLIDLEEKRIRGSIVQEGKSTLYERGFCWNTLGDPIIERDTYALADELFEYVLPLKEGEMYYVRAFIVTKDGVIYGPEKTIE